MLSNKNRIFIPNIIDTSRVNEVLSQFPSNPSLDITMIKLMATGAALNDQFYSNPRLAPIGLETTKFIDFVNLMNADLRGIYNQNASNWNFSHEEELLLEHYFNESLKPHKLGFPFFSKIESSIAIYTSSYINSDETLLKAFPKLNEFSMLLNARFMHLLELNANVRSNVNLGNFDYSSLTISLIAISLIGGELFHNVDFYNLTSQSFDILQSYMAFKDYISNNINILINLISTYGLNSFLALDVNQLSPKFKILQAAGPASLGTYFLVTLEQIKLPCYLGYIILPIVKGVLGVSTAINPHLGNFSAKVLTHTTFYTVSLAIPFFKFLKFYSISNPLEQVAASLNPQDILGYQVPLKKVIFMAYSLILIGGVVAQKLSIF